MRRVPLALLVQAPLVSVAVLSAALAGHASHTVFNYQADRFELLDLNGDVVGADDFDDGGIAPWTIGSGTVVESGGFVTFSNPGRHRLYPDCSDVVLDESGIYAPNQGGIGAGPGFSVKNGVGDFVATTTWAPVVPDLPGGYYASVLFYPTSPGSFEAVSLNIHNFDTAVAAAQAECFPGVAFPPGLAISQGHNTGTLDATGTNTGTTFLDLQNFLIQPSDVTGNILFRIQFDDETDLVTTSFSLDGGTTFLFPFAPVPSSLGGFGNWALQTDPLSLLPPCSDEVDNDGDGRIDVSDRAAASLRA